MKTTDHINMPNLRLLPTEALVLHEHADEKRVARLETRLSTDGFLKNPPIVAPIPGTERYVVLDGANRTSAVARLGSPHVLVQLVDYNSNAVQLSTWHHLITGRKPDDFLRAIAPVPGLALQPVSLEIARAALRLRTILAYVAVPMGNAQRGSTVFAVDGMPGTDHHNTIASNALINSLVDTYKDGQEVTIHRSNSDNVDELIDYYDNVAGLVVFQPYTPADILALAEAGTKVPTGITRHIINPRALRVNVPMSLLSGPESLEEKNAWWHEQFKSKLAANEVRMYQESTYLFDE
ncbi:MAG: ParB N-terminal domain-containing protein [Chloroflexota bacterium]